MNEKKVPKHVYSILRNQAFVNVENKRIDCLDVIDVKGEVEWNYIHYANFKCTIETQLRYFILNFFISSGVATGGGTGGRVPPVTAKKLPKIAEKREKIGEKRGKIGKKRQNSGRFFHFAAPDR